MTTDIDLLLTAWSNAERTGDTSTLDELLTDDFIGIGPVGFVVDKPTWLRRFDMGLRYDHLELDEVSIRRHGDTALVIAHQLADGRHADMPTPPNTRVSFTVVEDDGRPRIAALQYSFVGAPLGAPQ
jgi:ketosteroid isomerase-like protein